MADTNIEKKMDSECISEKEKKTGQIERERKRVTKRKERERRAKIISTRFTLTIYNRLMKLFKA